MRATPPRFHPSVRTRPRHRCTARRGRPGDSPRCWRPSGPAPASDRSRTATLGTTLVVGVAGRSGARRAPARLGSGPGRCAGVDRRRARALAATIGVRPRDGCAVGRAAVGRRPPFCRVGGRTLCGRRRLGRRVGNHRREVRTRPTSLAPLSWLAGACARGAVARRPVSVGWLGRDEGSCWSRCAAWRSPSALLLVFGLLFTSADRRVRQLRPDRGRPVAARPAGRRRRRRRRRGDVRAARGRAAGLVRRAAVARVRRPDAGSGCCPSSRSTRSCVAFVLVQVGTLVRRRDRRADVRRATRGRDSGSSSSRRP